MRARLKPLAALALAAASLAAQGGAAASEPQDWSRAALARALDAPLGLPPVPHPADNPPTRAKIELGRKLFFDRRLSINRTMSCAMCHIPEQGFANREMETAVGVEGRSVRRNAPTILNVAHLDSLFVDGRDSALETQYLAPLTAANEMANPSAGYVVALLARLPDYEAPFRRAFGAGPSLDRIGMAFAAYQRSVIAGDSRFDRWYYGGEATALSAPERRGFALFAGVAGCTACHRIGESFALFTDQAFHDTGYGWWREQLRQNPPPRQRVEVAPGVSYALPWRTVASVGEKRPADLGRYEVTLDPADRWKFRTPGLRNVALTPPYMHDGGLPDLIAVLRFYNDGGRPHPGQDPAIRPLGLEPSDLEALAAFLAALTSAEVPRLVEEARSAAPDNW